MAFELLAGENKEEADERKWNGMKWDWMEERCLTKEEGSLGFGREEGRKPFWNGINEEANE
jgi:hypothetical protein